MHMNFYQSRKFLMKKIVAVFALSMLSTYSYGVNCLHVTSETMNAVSEKIISICREEFNIHADYKYIRNFGDFIRNGENYSVSCMASCRRGMAPNECGDLFINDFVRSAVTSLRQNDKLEQLCVQSKKKKSNG